MALEPDPFSARFRLLAGEDALVEYRFNTGAARHLFCGHCGVKAFYVPRSHSDGFSVNVRCINADTIEDIAISVFDDNDLDAATAALAHLPKNRDFRFCS